MLGSKLDDLAKDWSIKIENADAIVVGGGNLFQDDDLNFPLKIGKLFDCVRKSGKPLAIYSVGVSNNWSPEARELFGKICHIQLLHVSVRDNLALKNWRRHFPSGPSPLVLVDPGLLAYNSADSSSAVLKKIPRSLVGICVTDPVILQRHAGGSSTDIALKSAREYSAVIKHLIEEGYRIRLFCNGAREDQAFAKRLLSEKLLQNYKAENWITLAVRPQRPEDLVDIIQSVSVVLAHRLHACIAAYALAIPHVGLGWDPKVESFFQIVGRDSFFAGGLEATPVRLACLVKKAEDDGIGHASRLAMVAAAAAGIQTLYEHLYHLPPRHDGT
ncbi:hypothetical protein RHI9324_04637 [Rhizobium sp. CECT 9324]|nr:hypothetical protein RHI9324_04637 [Rhizobium sp. CECT 9324]